MQLPEAKRLKFKTTSKDRPRGTILLTGMPRAGKTTLAAALACYFVGQENVFLKDFPEEEGTGSLSDRDIAYAMMGSQADLDELYSVLVQAKPRAIIADGLGSWYWMLMKEKVPSGIPPEDHGKTWMAMATALRREITRFKTIPSVEWYIATSLVWPDKDEITGREGRIQVVLPGQLKSNIYGLFSYNLNIVIDSQPDGKSVHVLECQPTARTVAGCRAPMNLKIPPRVPYDLERPNGVEAIVKALQLKPINEEVKASGE